MNKTHEADDSTYDDLSALLDGELSDQSARLAIRRLGGEPDARTRFAEYCAIGDLLRGHHHDLPGLTEKVMAALEDEPTVLAPRRKATNQRPLLWLAAAACAAITWGLWGVAPRQENIAPLAAAQIPAHAPADVAPYLAAHQDYAQAVLTVPEMHFTRVSLSREAR
ncbi:MAG: sigma-E factor negative regulatory protein [Gallionellaceae bacterium]|nr:sigma-E factor negative regulatory protein [Gallionellaceae bacterium]